MSFLRKKIAPIRPDKEPGGPYPQPLTVYLQCDTNEVIMYYTLDGTSPVANSTRSHGFESHTYNPISGIPLKGGGSHSITVVARRPGFLSPPVVKLKYVVEGQRAPDKHQALGDAIIDRRFHAMANLDPPMPLRLARAKTPDLRCALVDTCGKQELKNLRKQGELALFQLTHNSRSVSRQDTYRRIVPPSLSVALPQLPNKQVTGGPLLSIRSSADNRFALTCYERPDFDGTLSPADEAPRSKTPGVKTKENAGFLATRSKTPGLQGKTLGTTKGPILAKNAESGYLEKYNYKMPPRSKASSTSFTNQLAWFETRTGLVPNARDEYEDPRDAQDAQDYADRVENTMTLEGERLQHSIMYSRSAVPGAVSLSEDVAGDCKDFMFTLHAAQQICHSPLARLLTIVPYNTVAPALGKGSVFAAPDLAAISDGAFTVVEATKALKGLGLLNENRMVNSKFFLILLRFLVWKSRPIPEAVFGLAVHYWKMVSAINGAGQDARLSQMEMNMILDWYANTRGCHEKSLQFLRTKTNGRPNLTKTQQAAVEEGRNLDDKTIAEKKAAAAALAASTASFLDFESEEDSKIPYTNLFHVFPVETPLIDAALLDMNTATHPMYSQTLSMWGH